MTTAGGPGEEGAAQGRVRIRYRRPPDREDVFEQEVVHRERDVVVTLLERTPLRRPMVHGGRTVLENGSPVVWFTFPGAAHDIGRFHLPDGTFTGFYANVLTPVIFHAPDRWSTTDLFLDVWLEEGREPQILDEEDLAAALARGWVDGATAASARAEADRILGLVRAGSWPPPVVREWTLERARAALARPRYS